MMVGSAQEKDDCGARAGRSAIMAPLRYRQFRAIWLASLLSNLGLLIQGVGAAWAMTVMAQSVTLVALVQSALMMPVMLFAVLAGALADMYDRRKLAMVALGISFGGAASLTALAALDWLTPWVILGFCFVAGTGMALFSPAWQASVGEQVPAKAIPPAVALNGISFNLARSFGPALGGMVVATGGAVAAFGANAASCLPMLFILYRWQRPVEPARLPPERLGRAIISGLRYVLHSPIVRAALFRAILPGFAGGALLALMPLVARSLLYGDARLYGLLLGLFGAGAVCGALAMETARRKLSNEMILAVGALAMGLGIAGAAVSRTLIVTSICVFVSGAAWVVMVTLFNVVIQLSVPRWVAGRSLAIYQATLAAGVALGSALWGEFATDYSVTQALLMAGGLLVASPLIGLFVRMPQPVGMAGKEISAATEPEVQLAITGRSGPIVIEIDYRVPLDQARSFYRAVQDMQQVRQRNGAYDWSISRDIAQPEYWTERFHCVTWLDYQRQRNRATEAERAVERTAAAHQWAGEAIRVRRMLERPFGSVRWREETPDKQPAVAPGGPGSAGF